MKRSIPGHDRGRQVGSEAESFRCRLPCSLSKQTARGALMKSAAPRLLGALIGCGFVSRFHVEGWAKVSQARLAALCDLDRQRLEQAAAKVPGARLYTDAAALFESDQGLDFVEICRHGSNAGHSSGVAQGQRSLNRCSGRDFQHKVFAPTATAAFPSQTVAAGMLLPQRPTRRVLSCATAKLLRDEAREHGPEHRS